MKQLLLFLSLLIYQCTGSTYGNVPVRPIPDLVVQSQPITQLYGQTLIQQIGVKDVILLDANPRPRDVREVLSRYVVENNVKNATLLGDDFEFTAKNIKYVPLLSQIKLNPKLFNGPIYVISSDSPIAKRRTAAIRAQLPDVTEFIVATEMELRSTIAKVSELPQGFIFLNVFYFTDTLNQTLSYLDAETILIEVNRKHVDVGICHADFKTAFAVGPVPEEVTTLLVEGTTTASVCASFPRLRQLGMIAKYASHMGEFYRVVAPAD